MTLIAALSIAAPYGCADMRMRDDYRIETSKGQVTEGSWRNAASKADYILNQGIVKLGQHDSQGAIADFTSAIELNPELAEAYLERGLARADDGDPSGAILDYDKAIELKPTLELAYYNRGNARNKYDYDGAIADYTRAIELNPSDAEAYGNRGWVKSMKGDYAGALADYDRNIEINPSAKQTLEPLIEKARAHIYQ